MAATLRIDDECAAQLAILSYRIPRCEPVAPDMHCFHSSEQLRMTDTCSLRLRDAMQLGVASAATLRIHDKCAVCFVYFLSLRFG